MALRPHDTLCYVRAVRAKVVQEFTASITPKDPMPVIVKAAAQIMSDLYGLRFT